MTRQQLDALVAFIKSHRLDDETVLYKAFGFDLGRQRCPTCYGTGTLRPWPREWPALPRICSKCNGKTYIEG